MKKRATFTLDESTINRLKKLSKVSEVPQARIVERAILIEIELLESNED